MRELLKDKNIRSAYLLCLMLGTAYGMVMAIVSLFLTNVHHYDKPMIANLATFFSVGIAVFAVPMGMMIRRLSPRATLAIAMSGYGLAVAVFPFMPGFFGLAVSRAFDGAFSVGAWISLETILLLRTTSLNRGFVTGLYSNVLALGYVIGSVLAAGFTLLWPDMWVFVTAGALACTGSAYALSQLSPTIEPVEMHTPSAPGEAPAAEPHGMSIPALFWRIKTACIPPFSYGYFQGSLVLYLPLYLIERHDVSEFENKLVVAYFSLGMVLFVMSVGRLGDRFGHLRIIRLMAGLGGLITLSVAYLPNYPLTAVAIVLAGGALAPMWPLSLALQSLICQPQDYGRANGLLNASFALGAVAGPLVSSRLFQHYSGQVMVLHLAALWGFVVLASLLFRRDDPSLRVRVR